MDRYEVIDFDEVEKLPIIEVGIGDVILPYLGEKHEAVTTIPPFHPVQFMSYIKDRDVVPLLYHPAGTYHKVDLSRLRSLIKLPAINHPEVQRWIAELKKDMADWYFHPELGPFNLKQLNAETKLYDATTGLEEAKNSDYIESLRQTTLSFQERKEELDQYTTFENLVYVKEIRRWYPDFQHE